MSWPKGHVVVVLALALAACTPRPTGPPEPTQMRYPGVLVAPEGLAKREDFLARQSLVEECERFLPQGPGAGVGRGCEGDGGGVVQGSSFGKG